MTIDEQSDLKMSIVLMGWSLSMWATLAGGESATLGDEPRLAAFIREHRVSEVIHYILQFSLDGRGADVID